MSTAGTAALCASGNTDQCSQRGQLSRHCQVVKHDRQQSAPAHARSALPAWAHQRPASCKATGMARQMTDITRGNESMLPVGYGSSRQDGSLQARQDFGQEGGPREPGKHCPDPESCQDVSVCIEMLASSSGHSLQDASLHLDDGVHEAGRDSFAACQRKSGSAAHREHVL